MTQENSENLKSLRDTVDPSVVEKVEKMATDHHDYTIATTTPSIIKIIEPKDVVDAFKSLGFTATIFDAAVILDDNMENLVALLDEEVKNLLYKFFGNIIKKE